MSPGISTIEYVLPAKASSLSELATAGLLTSSAEQLQNFGFGCCYISTGPAEDLALAAAAKLLKNAEVDPESIDLLLYAAAIAPSQQIAGDSFLACFNYPAAKLQYELGMMRANAIGISQAGCTGLTYAVKIAADFLSANPGANRVLCVSADVLPPGASREIMYNVISDGACAVLVERDSPRNHIIGHRVITKGYYWDNLARKNEIVAAYFPTARNLILDVLSTAGCRLEDLRILLPHNVSLRSWEVLLGLIGLEPARVFAENIARKGHVIAADNWINLKDAMDGNLLQAGDKLLLFNFGFGANWAATLIEH